MTRITRESGLNNEEYRGAFWDIRVEDLIEDYKLGDPLGIRMSPEEYIDEFEHGDGYIHPDTVRRFLEMVKSREYVETRELAVVWEDDDAPVIVIKLVDLTEEDLRVWSKVYGKRPVGRMERFLSPVW